MGRRSTKEERYIANQRLSQMIDDYSKQKIYYTKFYDIVIENKNCTFTEILSKLNSELNPTIEISVSNIGKELSRMNNSYSATKAKEALIVLNLSRAVEAKNEKNILKYTIMLKKLQKETNNKSTRSIINGVDVSKENEEKHYSNINKVNEIMDRVISGEDMNKTYSYDEMYGFITLARKYLKDLDKEKYLNFIIKFYNLEFSSKKEIEELKEVITYFIKNLGNNIISLKSIDVEKEEELNKVNNIKVIGEEQLSEITYNYPKRLLSWKIKKTEKLYEAYSKYLKLLDKLEETDDYSVFSSLTPTEVKALDEDYDFVMDYVRNMREINNCYKSNVKNVYTINDNDYKELQLKFKNKIIER